MKGIEKLEININEEMTFDEYEKKFCSVNKKCKIDKSTELAMRNGAKINFMLDNISIVGDEDNRALMILIRPIRMLKIREIKPNTVKEILDLMIAILSEIIMHFSFDEILKMSNPIPAYTEKEIKFAREIYNKMKNELS